MIYTLDEIRKIASPIAESHGIAALYLFGSYARGCAREDSDIDFLVDRDGVVDLLELGGLFEDLQSSFSKKVDVVTVQMLSYEFLSNVRAEEIIIYKGKKV